MTIDDLIDQASAEIVEQLLAESAKDGGRPWFFIVRERLARLLRDLKKRKK